MHFFLLINYMDDLLINNGLTFSDQDPRQCLENCHASNSNNLSRPLQSTVQKKPRIQATSSIRVRRRI
jgi:hypothetical protein